MQCSPSTATPNVKRAKLTARASADLDAVLRYGIENFGVDRAVRYYNALIASFEWIAEHPQASRERPQYGAGIRFRAEGSHRVVYRRTGDGTVLIIRVLHGHQDPRRHLKR